MTNDAPTADDYASVDRAGEELHSRGWRKAFSVNEVVEAWDQFVGAVEDGYGFGLDEYWNDLSIRRWPEEARPLLTPLVARSLDARLVPLDARFRAATNDGLASSQHESTYWWESRTPEVLVGELADDLERLQRGQ